MSNNAEGWIRHRGGKPPVADGVKVDYRMRNGSIDDFGRKSETLDWEHYSEVGDIMAFRPHKPAEQVEACSKPDPRDSANRDSDYVCWMRDRITEIDANTSALATERAELVQKLASEGFALIGLYGAMSDSKKWMVGDLFTVVGGDDHDFEAGDKVILSENDGTSRLLFSKGNVESWVDTDRVEFHSRPSA